MNITTRTQGFEMTRAIDTFVREQLGDALERLQEDIIAVDVYMKDINGPKGGIDKMVLFRVRMRSRQLIATETSHSNLYAAIKNGVRRTKRVIRRQIRKSRRVEKLPLRDVVTQPTSMRVPWI